MEFKLGIDAVQSYHRLSYKVWYALAEFIDNSTQSYETNKDLLESDTSKKTSLRVEIAYNNGPNGFVVIEDNSIGMDDEDLENAFTVGRKSSILNGRSKYGLGMKTAAFWFGNVWEVKTKKLNHPYEYTVKVSLHDLVGAPSKKAKKDEHISSQIPLPVTKRKRDLEEHYTVIRITNLNRVITPNIYRRAKDHLRSFYRRDLESKRLTLIFQNALLAWNEQDFKDRMLTDEDGKPYYRRLRFKIGKRTVTGWAGILEKGSRKDAGFSLLQSDRVIRGWPDGYRPEKLFGEQEGGTNNLINQRLVGELNLDGFDVSHTKDDIQFQGDEEDQLDDKIYELLKDYRTIAEEYRKPKKDDPEEQEADVKSIVHEIFQQVRNPRFSSTVRKSPILPPDVLSETLEDYVSRMDKDEEAEIFETEVARISVRVIINKDGSEFDPYLVIRTRAQKDSVTIVINKNHKHWDTLATSELVSYFIKHCIYDGLAEWRAKYVGDSIEPDTIKVIKDGYLRRDISIN